jgi:hypothetical protein
MSSYADKQQHAAHFQAQAASTEYQYQMWQQQATHTHSEASPTTITSTSPWDQKTQWMAETQNPHGGAAYHHSFDDAQRTWAPAIGQGYVAMQQPMTNEWSTHTAMETGWMGAPVLLPCPENTVVLNPQPEPELVAGEAALLASRSFTKLRATSSPFVPPGQKVALASCSTSAPSSGTASYEESEASESDGSDDEHSCASDDESDSFDEADFHDAVEPEEEFFDAEEGDPSALPSVSATCSLKPAKNGKRQKQLKQQQMKQQQQEQEAEEQRQQLQKKKTQQREEQELKQQQLKQQQQHQQQQQEQKQIAKTPTPSQTVVPDPPVQAVATKAPWSRPQRLPAEVKETPVPEAKATPAPSPAPATPTSWSAMQQQLRRTTSNGGEKDVARTVRSILNKLTIDNFESMYRKLLNAKLFEAKHAEILVEEIFDKAISQHHFVSTYSKLCHWIHQSFMAAHRSKESGSSFQRTLLDKCQMRFETALQPRNDIAEMDPEDRLEAELNHKEQLLGTFKFVAALLKEALVTSHLLLTIAEELLNEATPLSMECLATFLTAVGPGFDRKDWPHHLQLNDLFDRFRIKGNSKDMPPRTRFLVQDLMDLRSASWAKAA